MPSDHTGAWPRPPHWQQYLSASSNWAYRGLKQENGTKTILDYIIINYSIPARDIAFTNQVTTYNALKIWNVNCKYRFSRNSRFFMPISSLPPLHSATHDIVCKTVPNAPVWGMIMFNNYSSRSSISLQNNLKQIWLSYIRSQARCECWDLSWTQNVCCHHITWYNQILPLPKPHIVV